MFFSPHYIFSLYHRHQRAAVHPADRDEDEQERTAGTRERQRDPGLTFDLFTLLSLQPLAYIDPPSLHLCWPSTAQPPDRRDRPNHLRGRLAGDISGAVSKPPFFFHLISLPLSPLFFAVVPLSARHRQSSKGLKKKKNYKKQLYYTHMNQSLWWNEKGASKHTYE